MLAVLYQIYSPDFLMSRKPQCEKTFSFSLNVRMKRWMNKQWTDKQKEGEEQNILGHLIHVASKASNAPSVSLRFLS